MEDLSLLLAAFLVEVLVQLFTYVALPYIFVVIVFESFQGEVFQEVQVLLVELLDGHAEDLRLEHRNDISFHIRNDVPDDAVHDSNHFLVLSLLTLPN